MPVCEILDLHSDDIIGCVILRSKATKNLSSYVEQKRNILEEILRDFRPSE